MSGLKIHYELLTEEIEEKLISICPFNAIQRTGGKLEINSACRMCKICVNKGPKGAIEFIEEEKVTINKDEWRGVTVYVDHLEGEIHPVTYELIGKARELAAKINHPVYALFIGDEVSDQAAKLLHYGVDKVFVYEHPALKHFLIEPYSALFADFIKKIKPSSILVGATNLGRSLAPRTAAHFRTGLTADCTRLEMKENSDLVQIRPAFGGNIMAQIVTENHRPQFCTVRYKIFQASAHSQKTSGEIVKMPVAAEKLHSNIEVLEVKRKEKAADISDAEVIVAVGRALKSEKDLVMIYELADYLDARVGCTRPLVEAGWFDPRMQIGLSGRSVKPKLILAIGISGMVQFTAGMQNSEFIIAINHNPEAQIFDFAHHAIVGDLYEVIPALLERLKNGQPLAEAI